MNKKILDNPKEYFNSLSTEDFDKLLKEYGFNFADTRDLTKEEEEAYMKGLASISTPTGINLLRNNINTNNERK